MGSSMIGEYQVGDMVQKTKGYKFVSQVRSVFTNIEGETRLVCESMMIPGLLHIFSPGQMEPWDITEFLADLDSEDV